MQQYFDEQCHTKGSFISINIKRTEASDPFIGLVKIYYLLITPNNNIHIFQATRQIGGDEKNMKCFLFICVRP